MSIPAPAFSHFGINVTDLPRMEDLTPQPLAEPFDIAAPVKRILAETESLCRSRPGFATRQAWRAAQVERMAAGR